MPEVIDNVKIGEYIKNLLKERNMTQSDLANELHISRSAISQNLSGKSTFDIQNLVKISEIFEISLDILLSIRTDEDKNVISEYERLIRRGIDEIKEISSEKINIGIPDLYGKVFIEYVIDYDKEDVFNYLIENNIPLFYNTHSNSQEVFYKILNYMISKNMNGFLNFVSEYVKEYGSFKITMETYEKLIIEGLENYKSKEIILKLFTMEIRQKVIFLHFIKLNQNLKVLASNEWARLIGKYHAESLLDNLIKTTNITDNIDDTVRYFSLYGFKNGLYTILNNLKEEQINKLKHKNNLLQKIAINISEFDDIKLFKKYINANIYNNLTLLTIDCIKTDKVELYNYLVNTHSQLINYRELGLSLIESKKIELIEKFSQYFSNDDYDYFLSKTNEKEVDTNVRLINLGAKINSKYLNKYTTNKVNSIIEFLNMKEETK